MSERWEYRCREAEEVLKREGWVEAEIGLKSRLGKARVGLKKRG